MIRKVHTTSPSDKKTAYLDDKAKRAIEEILKRGNDAQVQRKKDGCVVIEVKKQIKYTPD